MKTITKKFYFSYVMDKEEFPEFIHDYLCKKEQLLVGYHTKSGQGIFTDKKIILFSSIKDTKNIIAIPYKAINCLSISYRKYKVCFKLYLDSGHPIKLQFVHVDAKDKIRLRLLYSCISQAISSETLPKDSIRKLKRDDIGFR